MVYRVQYYVLPAEQLCGIRKSFSVTVARMIGVSALWYQYIASQERAVQALPQGSASGVLTTQQGFTKDGKENELLLVNSPKKLVDRLKHGTNWIELEVSSNTYFDSIIDNDAIAISFRQGQHRNDFFLKQRQHRNDRVDDIDMGIKIVENLQISCFAL